MSGLEKLSNSAADLAPVAEQTPVKTIQPFEEATSEEANPTTFKTTLYGTANSDADLTGRVRFRQTGGDALFGGDANNRGELDIKGNGNDYSAFGRVAVFSPNDDLTFSALGNVKLQKDEAGNLNTINPTKVGVEAFKGFENGTSAKAEIGRVDGDDNLSETYGKGTFTLENGTDFIAIVTSDEGNPVDVDLAVEDIRTPALGAKANLDLYARDVVNPEVRSIRARIQDFNIASGAGVRGNLAVNSNLGDSTSVYYSVERDFGENNLEAGGSYNFNTEENIGKISWERTFK